MKTNKRSKCAQHSTVAAAQHAQCARCIPAKCCGYFSLEVDTPRSKRDYDDLLWMIAHEKVSVYVDEKKWFLMIHNRCHFLDADTNRCRAYEKRPQMCREHSVDDCEWHGDYDFEHHFKSYDQLESWLEKKKC